MEPKYGHYQIETRAHRKHSKCDNKQKNGKTSSGHRRYVAVKSRKEYRRKANSN